jgi:hypothetical protein
LKARLYCILMQTFVCSLPNCVTAFSLVRISIKMIIDFCKYF